MSKDKRRFPRFAVAIPVLLKKKGGVDELVTGDVSRHGAFVRTDAPRPERELVQLTFRTPAGDVEAMCMVARAVRAGDPARGPGMGLDFFALAKDAKERWETFVRECKLRGTALEGNQSTLPQPAPAPAPASSAPVEDELAAMPPPFPDGGAAPPPPTRREHVRHTACFLVRMKDVHGLRELVTKDISEGGTFLRTPLLRRVGDLVEIVLVHPETDEEFRIEGIVLRAVDHKTPSERGLAVRFESLDDERRARLAEFIESGVEHIERVVDRTQARLDELHAAVEEEPDSPAAHEELGAFLLELCDFAGAVAALTKAMVLQPSSPQLHTLLARAYRSLGEIARAAAHDRVATALTLYREDLALEARAPGE